MLDQSKITVFSKNLNYQYNLILTPPLTQSE